MTEEHFYLRLRQQLSKQLPFVVYTSPKSTGEIKALLQETSELFVAEDLTESGFVFAPFDDKEEVILIPESTSEKLTIQQKEPSLSAVKSLTKPKITSEEKKREHINLVGRAVKALKAGEMDKVVLSRKEEVVLTEDDPLMLFKDLLKNYSSAFVYCWYHPTIGLWLGATPETLLKVEGNRFKTMALAGTQKYTGTMKVEWGRKEKQEQQFVTDSIHENLTRSSSAEDIQITAPYSAKAGNLLHLRTDISGKIITSTEASSGMSDSKSSLREIITSLHPTPAVCGLPKEKAKNFILQEENYDREFYTGYLGELNYKQVIQRSLSRRNVENLAYRAVKKETSLFVNLRCMKIEDGKAILFVGGGITKDSIPEDEWQETVDKAGTIKKVLLK